LDDSLATSVALTKGWRLTSSAASAVATPADLDWSAATEDAVVPGTVAATLLGQYHPDSPPAADYDDDDWWYQCEFDFDSNATHSELRFDGLATIADVWLNDELILESRNMFRTYRVDVSAQLAARNTLTIAFRSASEDLKQKRPRPRWKTRLINNQQLRWLRTTLLGRIPGWTPAIAPVGPWRGVHLAHCNTVRPVDLSVLPVADGSKSIVAVRAELELLDRDIAVADATLSILGKTCALVMDVSEDRISLQGQLDVGEVELWSPQSPALHDYTLSIRVGGQNHELQQGTLGFRTVEVDRTDGLLSFRINGNKIFCRGACWTINDIVSLSGDDQELRTCLEMFRSAGGNMIRIGGTMIYESDEFYRLCDELGILIWQDFMFANMDYPSFDTEFLQDVREEIDEQSRRLNRHPCVVALCGNSEVEQQAAMFGMTAEVWRNDLFYSLIPDLLENNCPGIPYFASSPSEGALPFHNANGPGHYFGVGAYQQPLASVEAARVKFASECLAFSNVPSDRSMIEYFQTAAPAVHHPRWKAGVPRDSATGWDFEDVRDHYIKELYGVDPIELRYADKERYIGISQVVTGEVMQAVFNVWRGTGNPCAGALIWQLKDIVPGAGWGFIDSDGRPKPVYYFLRRCWGDINFALLDRGLDGLGLRLSNETTTPQSTRVNVKLLQHSRTVIATEDHAILAAAGESTEISLDEVLGRFYDVTYRYRFGAAKHDVVVAALIDDSGCQRQTHCYFPNGHDIRALDNADVDIRCRTDSDKVRIEIRSGSFLQHVKLSSRTHQFDDNFFHLSPTITKTVTATPLVSTDRPFRGVLSALNLGNPIAFS